MKLWEYVESKITDRLLDRTKDKVEVSDVEFARLMDKLEPMMNKFTKRTNLKSVDETRLKSLYGLKVHQILRRDSYDRTKNPNTFFYLVLTNLNRDIHRLVTTAEKLGMEEDALDYSHSTELYPSGIEVEQDSHKLDEIMVKLSPEDQRFIIAALNSLDRNDEALIPIAAKILEFWE